MDSDIKKGLMGVTVDETSVSKVMPEINSLTYEVMLHRIYAKCKFEEVAYLILNRTSNKKQLKDLKPKRKREKL